MMNLHVYSQYSGRDYLPPEKQLLCEFESGNTILSITDHNCVKANPIALLLSKERGFRYISGIEMDCTYEKRNISVLGYGINANSRDFDEVDAKADYYEAFHHDFYAEGSLCYVKPNYMDVPEAVSIIHQNGGKVVLSLSDSNRIDMNDIHKLFHYKIDFIDFYDSYFMDCMEHVIWGSISNHLIQKD